MPSTCARSASGSELAPMCGTAPIPFSQDGSRRSTSCASAWRARSFAVPGRDVTGLAANTAASDVVGRIP